MNLITSPSTLLSDVTSNALFSVGGTGSQSSDQLQTNLNRYMNPQTRNRVAQEASKKEFERTTLPGDPRRYEERPGLLQEPTDFYLQLPNFLDEESDEQELLRGERIAYSYFLRDSRYYDKIQELLGNQESQRQLNERMRQTRQATNQETSQDIARTYANTVKEEKEKLEQIYIDYADLWYGMNPPDSEKRQLIREYLQNRVFGSSKDSRETLALLNRLFPSED
jgi:hypothetical protein